MDEKTAELVFWIVHLPLMVLFLAGMWFSFSQWLRGSVGGSGESTGRKLGAVLRVALGTVFSARLPLLIKTFVVEAWFNRRLYRNSFWRWLNHFLLLSGLLLLFTLSGISALSDKVLIHFFHLEHVPWIGMWVNPDHPITALLNEIGAVLMSVGFIFFVIRRYFTRVPQLRTGPMDTWMVIGLGLILLSGWVAEVARLNSSDVNPATAHFAFVGYLILAPLVRGLPIAWDSFAHWMYVIHGLLTSVVIVTIPFSKFMHAIAGAIVLIVREMEERYGHA
ncbi:MAG: respiratory nitrate reductase subunit gamma [Anaerolineae bacterium]|nr:respiratory nitrate reductase subunit gamma [Anaerolineae bacterium]